MARVIRAADAEAIRGAARIRRLAEEDARGIRESAREEGLAIARIEAAARLVEMARHRAEMIAEAENAIPPLVRSIVERILQTTFEENPTRIAQLLRTHLQHLHRAQAIEVTVHPDDESALATLSLQEPTFRILIDPTLQRGDILLESNLGRINARIALHLDAFEKALEKASAPAR